MTKTITSGAGTALRSAVAAGVLLTGIIRSDATDAGTPGTAKTATPSLALAQGPTKESLDESPAKLAGISLIMGLAALSWYRVFDQEQKAAKKTREKFCMSTRRP